MLQREDSRLLRVALGTADLAELRRVYLCLVVLVLLARSCVLVCLTELLVWLVHHDLGLLLRRVNYWWVLEVNYWILIVAGADYASRHLLLLIVVVLELRTLRLTLAQLVTTRLYIFHVLCSVLFEEGLDLLLLAILGFYDAAILTSLRFEQLFDRFDVRLVAEETEVPNIGVRALPHLLEQVFDIGRREIEQISIAEQLSKLALVYLTGQILTSLRYSIS